MASDFADESPFELVNTAFRPGSSRPAEEAEDFSGPEDARMKMVHISDSAKIKAERWPKRCQDLDAELGVFIPPFDFLSRRLNQKLHIHHIKPAPEFETDFL